MSKNLYSSDDIIALKNLVKNADNSIESVNVFIFETGDKEITLHRNNPFLSNDEHIIDYPSPEPITEYQFEELIKSGIINSTPTRYEHDTFIQLIYTKTWQHHG